MNRTIEISKNRCQELISYYMKFGCSIEEATNYCSRVFDYDLLVSENILDSNAWEIEFSTTGYVKKTSAKMDRKVYASWLNGGWSRSGFWEKSDSEIIQNATQEEECKRVYASDYNNYGNSYNYWNYIQKNHRRMNEEILDLQEISFLDDREQRWIDLKRFPGQVFVIKGEKKIFVSLKSNRLLHKKMTGRNHIFLVDVSGSMNCRLLLMQLNMVALFQSLEPGDTVSIITYSDECRLIAKEIAQGDQETFWEALAAISIIGGYGKKMPVLQTAYALLISMGKKGTITVFSDKFPEPDEEHKELLAELISLQSKLGNRLYFMVYGSDSWLVDKFSQNCFYHNGRVCAVLEPQNIEKPFLENWLGQGEEIFDLNIRVANDSVQASKDPGSLAHNWLCLTQNSVFRKILLINPDSVGPIYLELSWKDNTGEQSEQIIIP